MPQGLPPPYAIQGPAGPVDPRTSPAHALDTMLQQGLNGDALLNIMSMNQPATQSTPTDNGKDLTFEPFMISNHNTCSKLYNIRDFATVMPTECREGTSIKVGDIGLNLPETKPKLDSITLMWHIEAFLHILREMVTKDGTSLPNAACWLPH